MIQSSKNVVRTALPQFLQGQCETVARAVAIDPGEYRGRGERAALDRNAQLHEEGIVLANQRPV